MDYFFGDSSVSPLVQPVCIVLHYGPLSGIYPDKCAVTYPSSGGYFTVCFRSLLLLVLFFRACFFNSYTFDLRPPIKFTKFQPLYQVSMRNCRISHSFIFSPGLQSCGTPSLHSFPHPFKVSSFRSKVNKLVLT